MIRTNAPFQINRRHEQNRLRIESATHEDLRVECGTQFSAIDTIR
jgi:hypothetical protein